MVRRTWYRRSKGERSMGAKASSEDVILTSEEYSELIAIRDAAIALTGVISIVNSGMGIYPYGTEQDALDEAIDLLHDTVAHFPGVI